MPFKFNKNFIRYFVCTLSTFQRFRVRKERTYKSSDDGISAVDTHRFITRISLRENFVDRGAINLVSVPFINWT